MHPLLVIACLLGCDVSQETIAYLKDLYTSGNGDGWVRKAGWLSNESPCQWDGVACSDSGPCTILLNLGGNNVSGVLPSGHVAADVSGIDISGNRVSGTLPVTLGEMGALSVLNLRGNLIEGDVPGTLFASVYLNRIDLSENRLTMWDDFAVDPSGTTLVFLNISYNLLPSIPKSIGQLRLCSTLILDGNVFHRAAIPPELFTLPDLRLLSIQHSGLQGALPSNIGSLTALSNGLQLRNNSLSGTIPVTIGSLSHLTYLDIAYNNLTGPIPASVQTMTALRTLLLNNNNLTGDIPHELGLLKQMYYLDLSNNMLQGIPPSLGDIAASDVFLHMNNITGTIPAEFSQLYNVQNLRIDHNQLQGTIPPLDRLRRLENLDLGVNLLNGSFPLLPPTAYVVDISRNRLTTWNDTTVTNLAKLTELLLFENMITGTIPTSLCGLQSLSILDLRNNRFEGTVPPGLGSLTQLGLLYVSTNHLTGTLPDLSNLQGTAKLTLDFHGNHFHGPIPPSLSNLTNLFYLDLSVNELSGTIPPCLGQMTQLFYLEVSDNHLSGPLPDGLGTGSIRYLGASRNKLTSTIPLSIFSSRTLEYLSLESNLLSGPVPIIGEESALQYINLGKNELTGNLPEGLEASALLLHSNKLQGSVPGSIWASALLLHDNHLSCPLPNITYTPNVSIVLPGNEFTLPLPPWIVLHNADLLAVSSNPWHEYTWTWVAGGPAIITVLSLFYLEKNKRFLGTIAAAFTSWFILVLTIVVVAKKKFECGRIILRFSIAGIDSDSSTVMYLAVLFTVQLCVGTALVSKIVTSAPVVRKKKGRKRSLLMRPAPAPSMYRRVAAVVMFFFSAILLCIPSATYSASHSLPPSNVFGLHEFYFSFFFTSVLAPFSVLVCVAVVVPKLSRVLLKFGWGKADPQVLNRTVWAIRVFVSFGVPMAVLLILDQGCGQLWTSLWCGCTNAGHCGTLPEGDRNVTRTIANGLAPVLQATAKRLDYAPYSHATIMGLAESASPCYTSRKKGVCTRRVIEVLSPLLLSKLVMAAIVQPLSLVIQAYPYKLKYLKVLQKLFGGRELSAATRLAEFEGRLVWVTWLGFAAPPILAAMLMVTSTLAGFLKRVQKWRKVVWVDVCAVDALPLFSALGVAYAQAVGFWVDNEWEGTWLVGISPLLAALTWVLVKYKTKMHGEARSPSGYSRKDSESLHSSPEQEPHPHPAEAQNLVPPSTPQWDFLGVPCYGVTSIMPDPQEVPHTDMQTDAYTDHSASSDDEGLECGSLNYE